VKEDWYRKVYGPSASKTYETSLFNLITTEFGYIGGPDIVKLFTKKIGRQVLCDWCFEPPECQ